MALNASYWPTQRCTPPVLQTRSGPARRRAGHGVRAGEPGAEEPDHPRAQAPQPRGRVPGRRHQRRAGPPRRRRRHLRHERRNVARDAADIILLEPGLEVLHTGIREGRKAFGNVMKYLLMGTSSNFGNMFSMAGAAAFLPFLPMLPTHILLKPRRALPDQAETILLSISDTYILPPCTRIQGRDGCLKIG